jgi:all-trans-8'-apo-beta-carotenal 15,15'-oxygenase
MGHASKMMLLVVGWTLWSLQVVIVLTVVEIPPLAYSFGLPLAASTGRSSGTNDGGFIGAHSKKPFLLTPPKAVAADEETTNAGKSSIEEDRLLDNKNNDSNNNSNQVNSDRQYWEIGATLIHPSTPLTSELERAMETNSHPENESQNNLGRGVFVTADWRKAWNNYQSPPDNPTLIDPETGLAEYELDEIEGTVPQNLVGILYRNGPGRYGRGGQRVQHVLDADALIYRITFPSTTADRKFMFRSRFVETKAFQEERDADRFLYRGTFGTAPAAFFDDRPKNGLNADPIEPSIMSKLVGSAFNIDIKNSANTQVISFGGKLLALFEAGLPHSIDPVTLETLGEETMGGMLQAGLPVKLGRSGSPMENYTPDFLGGDAHTAHPNVCPKTGHLIGWHWAQLPLEKGMQITITEWSPKGFTPVATKTFVIPGCELAPHDMALTENYVVLKVNALKMNQTPFLLGLKGPAASLEMDGRAPVTAWIFPRPTCKDQFEPFAVEVPACFSIHFSHAYEDEDTGNIVAFFSGWPPSDSKDFLGAWGGFAPDFRQIPPTCLWRLEIDPRRKECVSLNIAPGAANVCMEHILVHPNFNIRKAENVYGTTSNLVGDSTPPCGYVRVKVESGSPTILPEGAFNKDVDAYWFGTRCFATEPIIVPKSGGDPDNEEEAYLLGMVHDATRRRDFLAIFDLERDLRDGPVAKIWLKSSLPHGLHGCFADENLSTSVFC